MKKVLITGASRGIGKATAEKFLKEGWTVYGTSTNGTTTIKNPNFKSYKLDISDPKSIKEFVKQIKDEQFDVLVNNAGIGNFDEFSVQELRKTMEVNVFGLIDLTEQIVSQVKGTIINVSSGLGSLNDFMGSYAPGYQISKTAINMYTRTLASRQKDLTIASFDPGWVKTDMGGKNAEREPSEPAKELFDLAHSKIDSGFFWHKGKKRSW